MHPVIDSPAYWLVVFSLISWPLLKIGWQLLRWRPIKLLRIPLQTADWLMCATTILAAIMWITWAEYHL